MRVIVVGASKGIGKGILESLEKQGHSCIGLSRSSEPPLDLDWPADRIKTVLLEAAEQLGGVDALVLSGGRGAYLGPLEATDEKMLGLLKTNFIGPVQCFYALQKELIRSRGTVLFIGSTVARKGARSLGCYAASKAAIEGWVKSEARQYARKGVRINVLAPGWIETEMTAEIKPELKEAIVRSIPLRRMGTVGEVAGLAVALLTQGEFLSGEVIDIAGAA